MKIAAEIHRILEFIASLVMVMGADASWCRTVIDVALGARLAHAFGLMVQPKWLNLHGIVASR